MQSPPKILFYIHALAGGGAERVWSVLASAFAERGYDVVFAVDYAAQDNLIYLASVARLIVLGGSHARNIIGLTKLIASEKPDVSISALSASNVKLVIANLFLGRLKRTVISFHGYAESEPQRLSQIGFWLVPLLSRLAAKTLCVSDGLLAYLRRSWVASWSRTARIYNPVLVRQGATARTPADLTARGPVVLAAGRMISYKNFDGLLRAFALVTHPGARLVILGDGPERGHLEAEINRLGLQERVEMPGYLPDPSTVFAQARCFVLPSKSESFGLVVVEALAQGLPVVATDCHGPSEILSDPAYGTLVPHADPAALAQAIDRTLADPGDPAPRLERAKAFSVSAAVEQYEALFHTLTPRPAVLGPAGAALAPPASITHV